MALFQKVLRIIGFTDGFPFVLLEIGAGNWKFAFYAHEMFWVIFLLQGGQDLHKFEIEKCFIAVYI